MKYHLCVTPERVEKTSMIMRAVAGSLNGSLIVGEPPAGLPFVVWGHLWTGAKIVPPALQRGTPFYFIDNGYYKPANGSPVGYYALTYRSFAPMLLDDPDMSRLPMPMKDWQHPSTKSNGHVLICAPGLGFGKMFGWDMPAWTAKIVQRMSSLTAREVVVRGKDSKVPLAQDIQNASVVITHSSKATIAAIFEGVPCIVEGLSSCAPVCGWDLSQVEDPPMPDRRKWWASLMCQQFTLEEMRRGYAKHWLEVAAKQGERDIQKGLPQISRLVVS